MNTEYFVELDDVTDDRMHVRFTTRGRGITNYAVLLTVERERQRHTVRLYDGAHGINEMHRYTRADGKQPGEVFHGGTLGEGMRAATEQIQRTCQSMIEAWEAQ
jgi:hypothetical protein